MRHTLVVLLTISLIATAAGALTIRGDRHWVGSSECPEGWRLLDFDDTDWVAVSYPWTRLWPKDWPLDRAARPIWGAQPSRLSCLRRSFELDALPDIPAVAHIWVDDDYDLYLNGIPVGSSSDQSADMPGETYDVTPLLRLGKNVIAVRGIDNGGVMAVLISVEIPGIPQPPPDLRDRVLAAVPWATFIGIVLAAIGWVLGIRWLMRRSGAQEWPPGVAVVVALVLTIACQLTFGLGQFYSSHREMPLASWNLGPLLLTALLIAGLALSRARTAAGPLEETPVRGQGVWLLAILLAATLLRTYQLDSMPPGFFQDEATNGNDALALGDLDHWAIWSDSVGGRPTLFLYMLLAALKLFGIGYLELKIVPVVVGVAGVAAIYAVGRLAIGPRTALWAAFLLAFSRWDIHYSRMAWEVICVPLFAALGFALLLDGLRPHRRAPASLIAAAVVLSSGLYTYAAYRAVPAAVLVFLGAILLSADRATLGRRWVSLPIAALVAACIAAPLALFAWDQPDLYWYRYSEVSLTSYMVYYDTPTPWLHQFGKGLLSLTSVGDEIVRHNLPWWPHLDRVSGGLMLLGMATALGIRRHLGVRLLWCWFLTFMALATLTMDGPHATRLLGVAPVAVLFAAFGVTRLLGEIGEAWRPTVSVGVGIVIALSVIGLNGYQYFVLERNHPGADFEYDVTGRSLCEYVRRVPVQVDLYWTDDIAYWSDGQCLFLARGRYAVGDAMRLEDVLPGNRFETVREPTLVVIGQEFIDRHRDAIPADEHYVPQLSLPVQPQVARDRDGRVLFYLYAIGLPPPPERS